MKKFLISIISCLFILLIWNEANAFHAKSEIKSNIYSNKLDNFSSNNPSIVDVYFFNNLTVLKKCAHYKNYTKLAQTESDDDEDDFVQNNVSRTKSTFAFLSMITNNQGNKYAFHSLNAVLLPPCYHLSQKAQIKYLFIHVLKI
ncbi:hypothetical protein [Rhizosphaericola mali]|uniref:Uncharacterized protein n=1 Tax=Rhizosphaericola mali TaxID=2545455 RepID=A0A5P2FXJ9_9BACT|nr:hypothetical protein [Rhizosphaericola mali]QES87925.1 hypothetical protein E0W69_004350 [Rhizosphaericola mali]